MASNNKKILPLPPACAPAAEALCAAMTKKFVDPAGTPYFTFKVEDGFLCAEGDAWAKKANERPAMGTMSAFAEGYVQRLIDDPFPGGLGRE